MNDLVTFMRNYDYELTLAKGTKWTLEEAVDYLAAYRSNSQNWIDSDNAYQGFLNIKEQVVSALQQAVNTGHLPIDEEYKESINNQESIINSEIDYRKSTVSPIIFINWAIGSNIEVPKKYREYAEKNKNDKSGYYEGLGVKKSCIHHERSRAIAEILWSIDPDIPIAVMARRSEITQFGCQGHKYDSRTIMRWLATLKPDRKPGRTKKNLIVNK